MLLRNYLIAMLIFPLIVMAFVLYGGEIADNYNTSFSSERFDNTINQTSDINDIVEEMSDRVKGIEGKQEAQSDISMITGSYSALRLVFNTFKMIPKILSSIMNNLGIPESFQAIFSIIVSIIIISIIFVLISAFLKNPL